MFADDIILYVENPKNLKKTVKINKLSKVPGYKIKMQNLVAFLLTDNKLSKKEIEKFEIEPIYNNIKNTLKFT